MRVSKFLTVAVCGALLAFSAGCKRSASKTKVAFVSNNPESFWVIAEAGAKKAADEAGVELLFRKPSPGNVATQKEAIDTALSQGVKGIAVSVIDPKNQTDYLDEIAAKADLIAVDNDAPKSKRHAYIGTDNYQAGRAAGKLVKEALGEAGGTVIIFVGQLDALNARQRRQGVIDELAGRPDREDIVGFTPEEQGKEHKFGKYTIFPMTYLDQPDGAPKAKTNAEDAIKDMPKDGNVCMVGLWAYNPPAIVTAVKDKLKDRPDDRKRVSIVGFDEDATTLRGIRDGDIYATVVQDPYNFGYQSVKMLAALAKGEKPAGGIQYIPYRVVAKTAEDKNGLKRISVETFEPELNKLLGK